MKSADCASTLDDFVEQLSTPRAVWLMLPSVRPRPGRCRGSLASWKRDRLVAARSYGCCSRRGLWPRQLSGPRVDSGEGRWTLEAAIDEAVPVNVIAAALFARFSSRGQADFQDRILSAMRSEFGGHAEKQASK